MKTTLHGAFGSESAATKKKAALQKANGNATVTVKKAKNGRFVVKMVK